MPDRGTTIDKLLEKDVVRTPGRSVMDSLPGGKVWVKQDADILGLRMFTKWSRISLFLFVLRSRVNVQ
jgi:hypothetical protein